MRSKCISLLEKTEQKHYSTNHRAPPFNNKRLNPKQAHTHRHTHTYSNSHTHSMSLIYYQGTSVFHSLLMEPVGLSSTESSSIQNNENNGLQTNARPHQKTKAIFFICKVNNVYAKKRVFFYPFLTQIMKQVTAICDLPRSPVAENTC